MKKGRGKNSGLLPNSFRIISSCLKTVSSSATNVVRSAGASVAASISSSGDDHKDQVTWTGFDKLEISPTASRRVLLLGYRNGFQVFDVEDASNFCELVSKREGTVTFLQMLPFPAKRDCEEGFGPLYPVLLVVAGEETSVINPHSNRCKLEIQSGLSCNSPKSVQFYSLKSNCYVGVQRFQSAVCMVRCSPRIVAVGLETQICCIDPLTLEKKFSVLTHRVPQFEGNVDFNIGYGPMAVGARWLAYASDDPLFSSSGRLVPKNLYPSQVVSPSTSPGSSSLMARYAVEQLTSGIVNLGDMGYRTLSRYCTELLPDGPSSPIPSSSSWKTGKRGASESENAGMVVIMDFVSRAVVSQFRAHTSPISALCFDPSGMLLVTVSIHGNNINIFRILPPCMHNGSNKGTHDCISSHVHLYKLYRGMTTAVIQDICFSHCSQWIAIVSSNCTCHIFVLSPFGGDVGFRTLNAQDEDPSLYPISMQPWWFTSSFVINQQSPLPPPPVTLSVVSRIKNSNSGLLSSSPASAAGRVSVPSGAVAAVFHNSISRSNQNVHLRTNSLEHLLVYTPTGQVIQYELLRSTGANLTYSGLRTRSGSLRYKQEDELRMVVEPVQWWDACRKSNIPQREESLSGTSLDRQGIIENNYGTNILDRNEKVAAEKLIRNDSVKSHERSNWYLSNLEVQVNYGRLPIWQKTQIRFYTMSIIRVGVYVGGEMEIENIPSHEVDIKQKDLLPVFDHFHSIKSSWNNRELSGVRYPSTSCLEPHRAGYKSTEETVICHSKPASLSSAESSDGGSSRRMENFLDTDQINIEQPIAPTCHIMDELYHRERRGNTSTEPFVSRLGSLAHVPSTSVHSKNNCSQVRGFSATGGALEATVLKGDSFDSPINMPVPKNIVDIEQFRQENHIETLEVDGCHGKTEVFIDSSDGHREKKGEPEDDDGKGNELLLG